MLGAGATRLLVDFLLECIGFPPGTDLEGLVARVRAEGEPVPWRGPGGEHLRLPLARGLDVRLDREEGEARWSLWPHYDVPRRLRVAVGSLEPLPDSPFDALLRGTANPPAPAHAGGAAEPTDPDYPFAAYLSNVRRIPRPLATGHVLAVSVAGFALDVERISPPEEAEEGPAPPVPLGGPERPGGAMELSLRVLRVRRLANALTGTEVDVVEVEAPGRPLELFLSPWQLAEEGLEPPRPGWRIDGVFVFTGRASGGLPSVVPSAGTSFG